MSAANHMDSRAGESSPETFLSHLLLQLQQGSTNTYLIRSYQSVSVGCSWHNKATYFTFPDGKRFSTVQHFGQAVEHLKQLAKGKN